MSIGQLPFPVVQSIAADFRHRYVCDPRQPGALFRAVKKMDRVLVKQIPRLSASTIESWLAQAHIPVQLHYDDRPLYGFLLVHQELAIIFLDRDAAEDEKNFTLAHELGHYLVEYCWPEKQAFSRIGKAAQPLFAQRRAPSPRERVHSALHDFPLSPATQLLDQEDMDARLRLQLERAERNADLLAFEIMAPFQLLCHHCKADNYFDTTLHIQNLLTSSYYFPLRQAHIYAHLVADRLFNRRSFREILNLS